jgi:hypothetical protein
MDARSAEEMLKDYSIFDPRDKNAAPDRHHKAQRQLDRLNQVCSCFPPLHRCSFASSCCYAITLIFIHTQEKQLQQEYKATVEKSLGNIEQIDFDELLSEHKSRRKGGGVGSVAAAIAVVEAAPEGKRRSRSRSRSENKGKRNRSGSPDKSRGRVDVRGREDRGKDRGRRDDRRRSRSRSRGRGRR